MLKRFSLILIMIVSPNLSARDIYGPDVLIYASLGTCKPLEPGDFKNLWSTGGNFNLGVGYQHHPGLIAGLYLRYYTFPADEVSIAEKAIKEGAITYTRPEPVKFPSASLFLHIDMAKKNDIFKPYLHFAMGVSKHSENVVIAYDQTGSWPLVRPIEPELLSFFAYGLGLEIKIKRQINLFGEIRYVDTITTHTNMKYLPVSIGIVLPFRVF